MASQKEVFETLLMMGYEQVKLDAAWAHSNNRSVEGIVDWIDSHPDGAPPVSLSAPATQTPAPQSAASANVNISKYVKAELVADVQKRGFSQLIAEKAVLMSGNESVEKALQWVEAHKADKDFEEPVVIEEKPQMSAEEAALKAKELQDRIRAKMKAEEEKNALEAEKQRVRMGKELTEQRRVMEEQQKKRDLEEYLRRKEQDERDREEMVRVLEADKKARFGDKYVEATKAKSRSTKEELNDTYDKMYKIYRMGELSTLHTCIKTLASIVSKVVANPADAQYREINALNPNFCQRVKDVIGGVQMLLTMGFQERDSKFIMDKVDLDKLKEIEEFLVTKRDFLATQ